MSFDYFSVPLSLSMSPCSNGIQFVMRVPRLEFNSHQFQSLHDVKTWESQDLRH